MLGYLHRGDHDPPRVSITSAISVMSVISCGFIFRIFEIRNVRNLMRIYCYGINLVFVTVFIFAGMVSGSS